MVFGIVRFQGGQVCRFRIVETEVRAQVFAPFGPFDQIVFELLAGLAFERGERGGLQFRPRGFQGGNQSIHVVKTAQFAEFFGGGDGERVFIVEQESAQGCFRVLGVGDRGEMDRVIAFDERIFLGIVRRFDEAFGGDFDAVRLGEFEGGLAANSRGDIAERHRQECFGSFADAPDRDISERLHGGHAAFAVAVGVHRDQCSGGGGVPAFAEFPGGGDGFGGVGIFQFLRETRNISGGHGTGCDQRGISVCRLDGGADKNNLKKQNILEPHL